MSIAHRQDARSERLPQDLRDERSEEAEGRIENLTELVSAAREYEQREPEPSLGGFVDQLSLLSDVDEEQGSRDARIWLMTMHSAKGLEFPMVIIAGLEEGLFPHSRSREDEEELEEERRLCYVGMTRARDQAGAHERRPPARVRRVPGDGALSLHRRDPAGGPELLERAPGSVESRQASFSSGFEYRPNPYGRGGGRGGGGSGGGYGGSSSRVREEAATYQYEDEDQSPQELRKGVRVRHSVFGEGTVESVEPLPDDARIVVRFAIGQKTLRAKYARLQLV